MSLPNQTHLTKVLRSRVTAREATTKDVRKSPLRLPDGRSPMRRKPEYSRQGCQNCEPPGLCRKAPTPTLSHLRAKDPLEDANARQDVDTSRPAILCIVGTDPAECTAGSQISERISCSALSYSGTAIERHSNDGGR